MISRIIKFNRISVKKINENRSAHNVNTFKNMETEREKRNFITEARNSKKSKTEISSLKNVFGDIYTDQKSMYLTTVSQVIGRVSLMISHVLQDL